MSLVVAFHLGFAWRLNSSREPRNVINTSRYSSIFGPVPDPNTFRPFGFLPIYFLTTIIARVRRAFYFRPGAEYPRALISPIAGDIVPCVPPRRNEHRRVFIDLSERRRAAGRGVSFARYRNRSFQRLSFGISRVLVLQFPRLFTSVE